MARGGRGVRAGKRGDGGGRARRTSCPCDCRSRRPFRRRRPASRPSTPAPPRGASDGDRARTSPPRCPAGACSLGRARWREQAGSGARRKAAGVNSRVGHEPEELLRGGQRRRHGIAREWSTRMSWRHPGNHRVRVQPRGDAGPLRTDAAAADDPPAAGACIFLVRASIHATRAPRGAS